jgi:CRP/FNR family transcriptional regulator
MKENPTFMSVLIQEMIKGWTESEERIYTLNGRRIYERLAEFLLKLEKREFANKEEKSIPIELSLPITRQVLASLLGTTKESIIRALSDFKNRGWIDVYRDKIFLLNKESLIRLVESG